MIGYRIDKKMDKLNFKRNSKNSFIVVEVLDVGKTFKDTFRGY